MFTIKSARRSLFIISDELESIITRSSFFCPFRMSCISKLISQGLLATFDKEGIRRSWQHCMNVFMPSQIESIDELSILVHYQVLYCDLFLASAWGLDDDNADNRKFQDLIALLFFPTLF